MQRGESKNEKLHWPPYECETEHANSPLSVNQE